jgi:hypothetical protein
MQVVPFQRKINDTFTTEACLQITDGILPSGSWQQDSNTTYERNATMQEIELKLTLAEVNQILAALGEKSYKEVFQLVSKIQAQATAQLNNVEQPSAE